MATGGWGGWVCKMCILLRGVLYLSVREAKAFWKNSFYSHISTIKRSPETKGNKKDQFGLNTMTEYSNMNKKVKRKSPVDHSAFTASTQDILKTK
jgi:hypothetical protein